jgi:hypothetical protein
MSLTSVRLFGAVTLAALMPTFANAGIVVAPRAATYSNTSNTSYGLIRFHPKEILVTISTHLKTAAKFTVSQRNNTKDHFRSTIECALNLGKKPRVRINGNNGTILFGRTGLPVNTQLLCQVTVLGEGGVTGTLPVDVTIGI